MEPADASLDVPSHYIVVAPTPTSLTRDLITKHFFPVIFNTKKPTPEQLAYEAENFTYDSAMAAKMNSTFAKLGEGYVKMLAKTAMAARGQGVTQAVRKCLLARCKAAQEKGTKKGGGPEYGDNHPQAAAAAVAVEKTSTAVITVEPPVRFTKDMQPFRRQVPRASEQQMGNNVNSIISKFVR
jgi:hypothetical protein